MGSCAGERLWYDGRRERLRPGMNESPKITIIEGPPPTFEVATEAWLLGLTEGLVLSQVAVCRVRTANGPQLVERCYRAWRDGQSISLEYRAEDLPEVDLDPLLLASLRRHGEITLPK